MSGPIDESRHPVLRIGADGTQRYSPKPYRELTADERCTIKELEAIATWMGWLYAERARRRQHTRRPGRPDAGQRG